MVLESGELKLWFGRTVELLELRSDGHGLVRFTDEGGISSLYTPHMSHLRPIVDVSAGECVLDGLQKAAAPHLTEEEELHRIAEIWLAAPEVGDVFHRPGYLRVTVQGGDAGGRILANVRVWGLHYREWSGSDMWFESSEKLRRTYRCTTRPGYEIQALSSRRADWADHPLINRPGG